MHILVTDNGILSTFSPKYKNSSIKYISFLKMKDKASLIQISNRLNIPYRTVQSWSYGVIPPPIKHIRLLKKQKLLPLKINERSEKFLLLVRCFAFVFGDGHINDKGTEMIFTGSKTDLKYLKLELETHFKLKYRLKPSSGNAYHLIAPSLLTKILLAMGAPKGSKIMKKIKLPPWLLNSSTKIKKEFLSTIFGNESNAIVRDMHTKNAFYPPQFSMNKIVIYEKNHLIFLNQIKKLLQEFGINTTKIIKRKIYLKKNGAKVRRYIFSIDRNLKNLIKFYLEIGFKYATDKQARYKNRLKNKIGFFKKILKDINIYHTVMKLRYQGYSDIQISRTLRMKRSKIRHWIYHDVKPKYLDAEMDIRAILNSFNTTT